MMISPSHAPKAAGPMQARDFDMYSNNGGTTLAVAGSDFCVLGADTRMSDGGYGINTRNYTKLCKLTDKCVLATSGMQADTLALQKNLRSMLQMYEHNNGKPMSTPAIAQWLSNTLYFKRFFPYYTFNVLGGVDDAGVGCCWSYDAVGSHERCKYSSSGTGQQLIQPLLDNQVGHKNQIRAIEVDLTADEAEDLIKDALTSAGERDIYTGDYADIARVDKNGVHLSKFELKFD
eukprot:TRINITY_DN1505_c0_g1_i1.p1 TRINITY_DN1505_c0_g1~~TRINITY_DN1505_c0_g1_i1.p1  ORF type:complete len:233 (-),score=46.76 TRINITY_DN1505_c0_g1_i1:98-796(-)